MLLVICWEVYITYQAWMYTSKQHISIITIVLSKHHTIKVKLLRQVARTSVEALFTGLNFVQQLKSHFIHETYQGPNKV